MSDELLAKRLELLWPYPKSLDLQGSFPRPAWLAITQDDLPDWFVEDVDFLRDGYGAPLSFSIESDVTTLPAEGYRLRIDHGGVCIEAADERGRLYALQTFAQIAIMCRNLAEWPRLTISDAPTFRRRAFMVDLGRSIWSPEMLRRTIRMLRRLKLNMLHLHLIDDELCGLKFDTLPFGHDNPHALSKRELAEIGRYARAHGVEVMIEIETWGHVGALVHHMPELKGGDGVWGGASFLIGEQTFSIVGQMLREIAEVIPEDGLLHLGLDEAKWFLSEEMPPTFTPLDMIARYEEMARSILHAAGKDGVEIIAYADHHGRTLSPDSRIILQPWNYWIKDKTDIEQKLAAYATLPAGRTWFPMAGQSMAQHRGAYAATRFWCQGCASLDNVEGIDLAFWGRNDLADRFITLFAGAQYVWNPHPASTLGRIEDSEHYDALVQPIMQFHQNAFADLSPEAWKEEALEYVYRGFYRTGKRNGQPVAPTALTADTDPNQAFYSEIAASL
jgi:hypothetical protein